MSVSSGTEAQGNKALSGAPAGGATPDLKGPIEKALLAEVHRAFRADDLMLLLKLQSPKDPEKQSQTVAQITSVLRELVEQGNITEVAPDLFKRRLFFDEARAIEHAYIGGMGNIHYRFGSPVFRINIGVLSLYFVWNLKAGDWMITINDTTIGRNYGLARRLKDGTYVIGNRAPKEGEENYLQIIGRYISGEHLTLTLSGENVQVEDHETSSGTRVDFLTKEGLSLYRKAAEEFLQKTDPRRHRDAVERGRYTLDQLVAHHQNFENSFFGATVDSIIFARPTNTVRA